MGPFVTTKIKKVYFAVYTYYNQLLELAKLDGAMQSPYVSNKYGDTYLVRVVGVEPTREPTSDNHSDCNNEIIKDVFQPPDISSAEEVRESNPSRFLAM